MYKSNSNVVFKMFNNKQKYYSINKISMNMPGNISYKNKININKLYDTRSFDKILQEEIDSRK